MKYAWAIAVGGALLLAGCSKAPEQTWTAPDSTATAASPAADEGQPVVLATIFPIADIAAKIAGDACRVESLLPPGASPHTFELTPAQATLLADAAAVIRIGPGIDQWVAKMVGDKATVLTLTEHTELLHGFHHEHHDEGGHEDHEAEAGDDDPHVWLDPVRMRDDLAPAIAELLGEVVPGQKDAILGRMLEVHADLTVLNQELEQILAPVKDTAYVSAHPAWGYFDARYGLKMAAVIEELPGRDPSGQRISALVDQAKAANVKAVLAEKQQNKALAERFATEIGAKVGVLDPLGGQNVADCNSYHALLVHNAEVFAEVMAR